MITVHHLDQSRSQRILWLLEELELPYEVAQHWRDPGTRLAPAELKKVHPLGKSPVIADDGYVVAESGAIVDYLIRRHGRGRLQPDPATREYDDYVQWLHYAEGSAMLPLLLKLTLTPLGTAANEIMPRIERELDNHLGYINVSLANRPYLMGDGLSGADIQMSFVGELALARTDCSAYPNLDVWVGRFQARAAYRRALERGGDYGLVRPTDSPSAADRG